MPKQSDQRRNQLCRTRHRRRSNLVASASEEGPPQKPPPWWNGHLLKALVLRQVEQVRDASTTAKSAQTLLVGRGICAVVRQIGRLDRWNPRSPLLSLKSWSGDVTRRETETLASGSCKPRQRRGLSQERSGDWGYDGRDEERERMILTILDRMRERATKVKGRRVPAPL